MPQPNDGGDWYSIGLFINGLSKILLAVVCGTDIVWSIFDDQNIHSTEYNQQLVYLVIISAVLDLQSVINAITQICNQCRYLNLNANIFILLLLSNGISQCIANPGIYSHTFAYLYVIIYTTNIYIFVIYGRFFFFFFFGR